MFSVIRISKGCTHESSTLTVESCFRVLCRLVPSGIGFASPPHFAGGNGVSDISKRLCVVA